MAVANVSFVESFAISLSPGEVLANIIIYWFSNNIFTAAGIYCENSDTLNEIGRGNVPQAFAYFENIFCCHQKDS